MARKSSVSACSPMPVFRLQTSARASSRTRPEGLGDLAVAGAQTADALVGVAEADGHVPRRTAATRRESILGHPPVLGMQTRDERHSRLQEVVRGEPVTAATPSLTDSTCKPSEQDRRVHLTAPASSVSLPFIGTLLSNPVQAGIRQHRANVSALQENRKRICAAPMRSVLSGLSAKIRTLKPGGELRAILTASVCGAWSIRAKRRRQKQSSPFVSRSFRAAAAAVLRQDDRDDATIKPGAGFPGPLRRAAVPPERGEAMTLKIDNHRLIGDQVSYRATPNCGRAGAMTPSYPPGLHRRPLVREFG